MLTEGPRHRHAVPQLSAVLSAMQAERNKREKARKAATKVGQPLFEEDGKRRSILDKYDEEEEEAGLQIGFGGAVGGDDVARRQAQIRSRLAGVALSTANDIPLPACSTLVAVLSGPAVIVGILNDCVRSDDSGTVHLLPGSLSTNRLWSF